MTLLELYEEAKKQEKPVTPAKSFIAQVSAVTKKTPTAVYRWLAGEVRPDALTQEVLARHFGTTPEELFPPPAPK